MVKEWRRDKYRTKLTGKVLFVTCKSDCYEITSQAANIVEELNSTQEEADTRPILHAANAARSGTQTGTRYVSISSVVAAVGGELCKMPNDMHAFTGCDIVSAFAGMKGNSPTTCQAADILPRNVQGAGYGMGSIRYAFSEPPRVYM